MMQETFSFGEILDSLCDSQLRVDIYLNRYAREIPAGQRQNFIPVNML